MKKEQHKEHLFFYLLALILCFGMVYPSIFDQKLFLGGDNASYYSLAKGIASGNGYVSMSNPSLQAANHYPPGYPFIMSLFMLIGISSISAMKLINGLFLLGSAILVFKLSKRLTKNKVLSLGFGILLLLSSHALGFATIMMSEIPFMFFLMLTLHLFIRWQDSLFKIRSVHFYLMLLSCVLLIYIRTMGIVLPIAFLLYLLFKKEFKVSILLFSIIILSQAPWQIRSHNLGGNSYMKQVMSVNPYRAEEGKMKFGNWIDRVKTNSIRYVSKELPNALFPVITVNYKNPKTGENTPAPTRNWIIGILIIGFTLLGIWSTKEFKYLFLLVFAGVFGILLLWPDVWFGVRFFLPMLGLTYLFFGLGIVQLIQIVRRTQKPMITYAGISVFLIPISLAQVSPIKALQDKTELEHPKNWQNFLTVAEWSKGRLPDSAFVACRKPDLFFTKSLVSSSRFLHSANRKQFLDHLDERKFTHVIVEQLGFSQTGRFLVPVVQSEPDKFKVIRQMNTKPRKTKDGKLIQPRTAVWLMEYLPQYGYQGEYNSEGRRHGKGVYKYRNGSLMEGNWVNDTLNGSGTLTYQNGQVYDGTWKNGKKHGTFILTNETGRIESEWKNDTVQPVGFLLDESGNRIKQIKLK